MINNAIARLELHSNAPSVNVTTVVDPSLKGNEAVALLLPYNDDKDEKDIEEIE